MSEERIFIGEIAGCKVYLIPAMLMHVVECSEEEKQEEEKAE